MGRKQDNADTLEEKVGRNRVQEYMLGVWMREQCSLHHSQTPAETIKKKLKFEYSHNALYDVG